MKLLVILVVIFACYCYNSTDGVSSELNLNFLQLALGYQALVISLLKGVP